MSIALQGIVTDLDYQNEDSGYTVLHLRRRRSRLRSPASE